MLFISISATGLLLGSLTHSHIVPQNQTLSVVQMNKAILAYQGLFGIQWLDDNILFAPMVMKNVEKPSHIM